MISPATLLLRLRLSRWRLFIGNCIGTSVRQRLSFGPALALVCLALAGNLWDDRSAIAFFVDQRTVLVRALASTAALLAGFWIGRSTTRTARQELAAPWLASLPWPEQDRHQALLLCCLPSYGLLVASMLSAVTLEGWLVRWTDMAETAPAGLVLVSMAFAFGCFSVSPYVATYRGSRTVRFRHAILLPLLDRRRPRWLGNWALEGFGPGNIRICLLLLAILGGTGIAGSLQTGTAWPAALVGAVGGHLTFFYAVRCHPLRATALRVLPVPFARAAWGVLRLPLALSLGWFVLPGFTAFAVAPDDPTTAGCLIALLSLDGLLIVSALWLADSPTAARLLHFVVLLMAAQYAVRLGISEAFLLMVLVAVLWRAAHRRFVRGTR